MLVAQRVGYAYLRIQLHRLPDQASSGTDAATSDSGVYGEINGQS